MARGYGTPKHPGGKYRGGSGAKRVSRTNQSPSKKQSGGFHGTKRTNQRPPKKK